MAKISFNKLGAKTNTEVKNVVFNEQTIEVKQYLPLKEKMNIVDRIVEKAIATSERYYNPGEITFLQTLEILQNYTNISFTEKQLANTSELYDAVHSSGLEQSILNQIPINEQEQLSNLIFNSLNNFYTYTNSTGGILQTASQSSNNFEKLQDMINSSDLTFLKEIVGILG